VEAVQHHTKKNNLVENTMTSKFQVDNTERLQMHNMNHHGRHILQGDVRLWEGSVSTPEKRKTMRET
jgi:quercetin dioxygenase-like cupin family protein